MTRKDFCRLGGFALAAQGLNGFARVVPAARRDVPLLPDYWCTWGIQNALAAETKRSEAALAGDQGAFRARDNLNERLLFGAEGWATEVFEDVRKHLFLMLDDGWDVPYRSHPRQDIARFGFLEPWPERFASCGTTARERLATINARLREAGWQGAGLWVAAQREGDRPDALAPDVRDFYRRKIELSAESGIRYWKVDWGLRSGSNHFRGMVSELARAICPDLIVEHCPFAMEVFNDQRPDPDGGVAFAGSGRCVVDVKDPALVARFGFSDVIRTYDVLAPFGFATTLDRVAAYSRVIDAHRLKTRLNVEDAPVIGAVLGHAFGIMQRVRKTRDRARWLTYRRAVNWHVVAPPFGGEAGLATRTSDAVLFEEHCFGAHEGWKQSAWGHVLRQGAPAVVARGTGLPTVKPRGDSRPYVLAGRHPNGALSVGVLPRVRENGACWTPSAEISLSEPLDAEVPLAVFGEVAAVHVPVRGRVEKVWAADLADGVEREVPATCSNGFLHLDVEACAAACGAIREGIPAMVFRRS